MKKILVLFCFVCLVLIMCGCKNSIITSCDELRSNDWGFEAENGMSAKLEFGTDCAKMSLYPASSDEVYIIEGALSIDPERFYITSTELCRTYEFVYSVFADRVEVRYGENTLTFYKIMQKSGD